MQTTASTVAVVVSLGFLACALLSRSVSAAESDGSLLLVANKGDQTLSIVDPTSGKQIAAVSVGGTTGHEVAVSPDGRTAWVPIYGNSGVGLPGTDGQTISVIDLLSRKLVGQIELKQPSRPHCPIFGPKDGRLYVTTELTQTIQVIDPATRTIVDAIPTEAVWITIDKDVLPEHEVTSNWDQGEMPLARVLETIRALRGRKRILGADICGEYAPAQHANWFKRIEARMDQPRRAVTGADLAQNERVNIALLRAIAGAEGGAA